MCGIPSSDRISQIIAELTSITEFAVGSIISSSSYYTTKSGDRRQAKTQFKFQSRGGRGKQKLRHIPAELVPKVKRLTENRRRVETLEDEYARPVPPVRKPSENQRFFNEL